jgi:hypothetical protein
VCSVLHAMPQYCASETAQMNLKLLEIYGNMTYGPYASNVEMHDEILYVLSMAMHVWLIVRGG